MSNNFQYALLNATIRSQESLSNKLSSDSQSGIYANDLLVSEYDAASLILQLDANKVSSTTSSDTISQYNTTYQNDSSVAQTGESNASTATQTEQTLVSQDGTNLSNLVSLSSTLIAIGQYVAGLITNSY